jgi:RNA polymerase sigma-70 factor (ECF subfamily)
MVPQPQQTSSATIVQDSRWFMDEVHVHDASLKAYVRSAFPNLGDVEDVVQESYLRIWRIRATQTIHSARGFLFTLARRVALDGVRRRRASPVTSMANLAWLPAIQSDPNSAETILQQEKVRLLAKALAMLPERSRAIIVLRKFHSVPQKEVALQFDISEAAVEHHVSRGLAKCETYLRRFGIGSIYDE